jgi:hypothetical protein
MTITTYEINLIETALTEILQVAIGPQPLKMLKLSRMVFER